MAEMIYDDDEAWCPGDPLPEDIDWPEVERLADLQADAGSDPMKNLALLSEMYGDDLRVL
jgi:hypothetical protein